MKMQDGLQSTDTAPTHWKNAVKHSRLGGRLVQWRNAWRLHRWTAEDNRAAAFYRNFVEPGNLCFDIGANLGARIKVFRRLGASVVAVEPQEYCLAVLKPAYWLDRKVRIVGAACGESVGASKIMLADESLLSTLSTDWIADTRASGRFTQTKWDREQSCEVTTLDSLVQAYGAPRFIKIDVEGYELEVLRGLSRPVPSLSFEFLPERFERTSQCIRRLMDIGFSEFNFSLEESFSLFQPNWVTADDLMAVLRRVNPAVFGDVYARTAI